MKGVGWRMVGVFTLAPKTSLINPKQFQVPVRKATEIFALQFSRSHAHSTATTAPTKIQKSPWLPMGFTYSFRLAPAASWF